MEELENNTVTLDAVDIERMIQIIGLASSRGAFAGRELSTAGALHDKLVIILSNIKAQGENNG